MGDDFIESLARRLRPANEEVALTATRSVLRDALEQYEPSTLYELYMAVRAVTFGGGDGLAAELRSVAEGDPNCSLVEFVDDGHDRFRP